MREPNPVIGYGLGVFVQDLGPGCGTVLHHNGSPPGGYGSLMYSSPDGSRTMTAALTTGDADIDVPAKFRKLLPALVEAAFCTG